MPRSSKIRQAEGAKVEPSMIRNGEREDWERKDNGERKKKKYIAAPQGQMQL